MDETEVNVSLMVIGEPRVKRLGLEGFAAAVVDAKEENRADKHNEICDRSD